MSSLSFVQNAHLKITRLCVRAFLSQAKSDIAYILPVIAKKPAKLYSNDFGMLLNAPKKFLSAA